MRLNTISPAAGSKKTRKRVGRGIGSGNGKTCGRGHKGQKSRSGGQTKIGFEGGQMPFQRRLPKIGFYSRKAKYSAEVRLYQLTAFDGDIVSLETLKSAGLVPSITKKVKVVLRGEISRPVTLQGVAATAGAKAAIEAAGGKVEE